MSGCRAERVTSFPDSIPNAQERSSWNKLAAQSLGKRGRRTRCPVVARQVKEEPLDWENHSQSLYPIHPALVSRNQVLKPVECSYSEAGYLSSTDSMSGVESKPFDDRKSVLSLNNGKRKASISAECNMWPTYVSPGVPHPPDQSQIVSPEAPAKDALSFRNNDQASIAEDFLEYMAREMHLDKSNVATLVEFPPPREFEDFVSYLSRLCGIDELKLRSTLPDPRTCFYSDSILQHSNV